MIVNFHDLQMEPGGKLRQPVLFLKTMTGAPICPVSGYYDLQAEFRFNDVSEISFSVPRQYMDGDRLSDNPCFEKLSGMRTVTMEPYGTFILVNPTVKDDGITQVKECKAYSLEYELNYKTVSAISGTYMFYDPVGKNEDTIMDILLSGVPGWKIGHIDTAVATRYRTFDISADSVYSLMMNTLQESYSCMFLFETEMREIHVYDAESAVSNVPLFLSKVNLIENQSFEELSDEIVTCLSVYGAEDTDITSVNPIGGNKIYNLDYFIEIGDIPETLGEKWKRWQGDCKQYQNIFSKIHSAIYTDSTVCNGEVVRLADLQKDLDAQLLVMDSYKTNPSGAQAADIAKCQQQIDKLTAAVAKQRQVVEKLEKSLEENHLMLEEISGLCSFDRYFTADELKELNPYLKEDSLQDSTYVVSEVSDEPQTCRKINASDGYQVSITKGNIKEIGNDRNLSPEELAALNLSETEKRELLRILESLDTIYLGRRFFSIDLGVLTVQNTSGDFSLTGTVVNSTLSVESEPGTDGSYGCTVVVHVEHPTYNGDDVSYSNGIFVVSGSLTGLTHEEAGALSFQLTGGTLTLTLDASLYQQQNTVQDLYDYGVSCLAKLARPSYEFSVDSANFMALAEFSELRDQITLGKSVNLEWKDGVYLQPILIEMKLNFEQPESFQMTLSNKFRANHPEFLLADTIGKTAKQAASLDASKFSYSAFHNSNIENDVEKLIHSALDVSKRAIINGKNQDVLIDGAGIHLRRLADRENQVFDPCEVRMIHNQIVFTDDGWNTAGLALGKLSVDVDGTEKSVMGVVAESLIGNILIGNKLTIEATGVDAVTQQPNLTHFRVDGSGAYLGNAAFVMQGAPHDGIPGNQMVLDPRYGLVAGDHTLFSIGSGGAEANFIDDDGKVVYDATGVMPEGASLYFDAESGNASFRGNVYAENGCFKGRVEATEGYFNGKIQTSNLVIEDNAVVQGLEVGKNVTMGADAKITWEQLPSGVASAGAVTAITQNAIQTGDLHLGGKLYHITDGDAWWGANAKEYLLLGVNGNNNLQIGSPSTNVEYEDITMYAREHMYFMPGGAKVMKETDGSGGWTVRLSNDSSFQGMKVRGQLTISDVINANGGINVKSIDADFMNIRSIVASGTIRADYFGTNSNYATLVHANNVCIHTNTTISNNDCGFSSSGYLQKYSGSSKRFKHDINDMSGELIKKIYGLYDIEIKEWVYNDDYIDSEDQLYQTTTFGLIAEDVYSVLPDAVILDKDGLVENYRDRHLLNAMLVLIQDQKKEIDKLKESLEELKGEMKNGI